MTEKLTISDVEEIVNEVARQYAKQVHDLPPTAIRIILWPTDKWITCIQRGPTAIIRMGRIPGDPVFNRAMRNAIDHVVRYHMYDCMILDRTADIVHRDTELRRVQRERFNFDRDLIPDSLEDNEIRITRISRIEVTHRETGLREVIEVEVGKGNMFTLQEIAKARLARRIHEAKIEKSPFDLPIDDPNWIAKTA